MKPGTYRAADGVLVTVKRTENGLLVIYPDGRVTTVKA